MSLARLVVAAQSQPNIVISKIRDLFSALVLAVIWHVNIFGAERPTGWHIGCCEREELDCWSGQMGEGLTVHLYIVLPIHLS